MKSKVKIWLFALMSSVVLLSGCAMFGAGADSSDPAVREKALRERVTERADAIIAMDFKRVYEFATPAYRQTYDFAHFSNQYAAQIQRTGYEIYQVKFDESLPDTATVVTLLKFKAEGGAPGSTFDGVSRVVDTWVRQDGRWWHVEAK